MMLCTQGQVSQTDPIIDGISNIYRSRLTPIYYKKATRKWTAQSLSFSPNGNAFSIFANSKISSIGANNKGRRTSATP
jgi:hypothetical protein